MKTKILVIEDNQDIVEVISLVFQLHWPEAQVVSTNWGEKGIKLVRSEAPDAIILDLGLPDISGYEVLRQIRSFSLIPVIVLSARAQKEDMLKALEYEADDYMTKPFRHRELLTRVKNHATRWIASEAEVTVA